MSIALGATMMRLSSAGASVADEQNLNCPTRQTAARTGTIVFITSQILSIVADSLVACEPIAFPTRLATLPNFNNCLLCGKIKHGV